MRQIFKAMLDFKKFRLNLSEEALSEVDEMQAMCKNH